MFYRMSFSVLTSFGVPADRIPRECRRRPDVGDDMFDVKLYYAGMCPMYSHGKYGMENNYGVVVFNNGLS